MIVCGFPGNMDYRTIPSRQIVTFKANNTRSEYFGTFVLDDDLVEVDETFDIYIDPSSLPEDVSLGDPCEATVTIKDDDCEWSCNNEKQLSAILARLYWHVMCDNVISIIFHIVILIHYFHY